MNSKALALIGRALRTLAVGLTLAVASHPLAAMEELTVNGAKEAALARAQQARFESQMQAFIESVGAEFKGALEVELQRSMAPEVVLVAVNTPTRG